MFHLLLPVGASDPRDKVFAYRGMLPKALGKVLAIPAPSQPSLLSLRRDATRPIRIYAYCTKLRETRERSSICHLGLWIGPLKTSTN